MVVAFLVTTNSYAVSLDGTWQEDKERSFNWNSINSKADPESLEKLAAIMGHMYFTYKDGLMCQFFEPYTLKYKGNISEVSRPTTEVAKYQVVSENEFGFVLNLKYSDSMEAIEMLIYESEDSFYGVRLTTEDYGLPGLRIYFKKVAPVKWDYDCEM